MTGEPPHGLNARNTTRGRPRSAGAVDCDRCGHHVVKARVNWPEGQVCGPCFTRAMRTWGACPQCNEHRLLPGPPTDPQGPACAGCAGIDADFHCTRCGHEGEFYRRGICARCALREDLTALLGPDPADPASMTELVQTLCAVSRPESILTWKRSPKVHRLLTALASGATALTHDGLDHYPGGREVDHLRALLVHAGLLPPREAYLARFEQWITVKVAALPAPVAQPVQKFATWHHLRRIRTIATTRSTLQAPVHAAKQEITETAKFLSWLYESRGRTVAECTQTDIDTWLAAGLSTRSAIGTFIVFAAETRLSTRLEVRRRLPQHSPSLTQDQRLAWLGELLTGHSESLPYRVAGTLLLLYAQPLVKVAALPAAAVTATEHGLTLSLGKHPTPLPEPFAALVREHLARRPNLRTATGGTSPWLFPGTRPGQHLHPNTLMIRLRHLGVNLLGARNRALADLVTEVPPPVVADALGYNHHVIEKHANAAAETWARYVGHRT